MKKRFLEFGGRRLGIQEWSDETSIPYRTILTRLRDGWDISRALTEPSFYGKNQSTGKSPRPSAEQKASRLAAGRRWREKNIEAIRAAARTPESRKKNAERRKKYLDSSPMAKFSHRMRVAVRVSICNGRIYKGTESLLGYTFDELREHIERQFLPGMGWHNIEDWHIDHIIPLSSFGDITGNIKLIRSAWAMSNLRPIWAADNIRKHAKVLFLL